MRNPWVHDVDDDPAGESATGARNAVRLGVALWLLVGVAAVGLYLGWSVAPREGEGAPSEDGVPSAAAPEVVLEFGSGRFAVLLSIGGRHYGLVVDASGPRLEFVLADTSIVLAS